MLKDARVLELSGPESMLAGLVLADLGADVVVVEPPEGALGRRLEPFLGDAPGLERSLPWHALNRNKRAITLDLSVSGGRRLLASLSQKFDVALEVTTAAGASSRRLDAAARAQTVEQQLQRARVAAHVVSKGRDLYEDAHLRAVGHLRRFDDPVIWRRRDRGSAIQPASDADEGHAPQSADRRAHTRRIGEFLRPVRSGDRAAGRGQGARLKGRPVIAESIREGSDR